MSRGSHVGKAYLLASCPFSFKFLLFMSEAGLLEQIKIVRFDVNEDDYQVKKSKLEEQLGGSLSFPTVEIEPSVYKNDSDALIEYYSSKNDIKSEHLKTLDFYKNGIFKEMISLFIENQKLKEAS